MESEKAKRRFQKIGIAYIMCWFAVLIIMAGVSRILIRQNNMQQMNDRIGLMAEKVNASFDMMQGYVEQAAAVASMNDQMTMQEQYDALQVAVDYLPYMSVGMVGDDGIVYGSRGEQIDFEKYEFASKCLGAKETFISEPYRSSVTGSNVITMFAPLYAHGKHSGSLFMTYELKEIQELAHSEVLKDEADTFLMNALSGNYITCSKTRLHEAGVWGNMSLIKQQMEYTRKYTVDDWMKAMQTGEGSNILAYRLKGQAYTQAFVKISCMDNWFVVVQIPDTGLTMVMNRFVLCVSVCAGVLVVTTVLFGAYMILRERRQKKDLQTLSDFDPLTRILNRRAFEMELEQYITEHANEKSGVYMFMDIDFYKEVNDQFGHAVGDEVLRKVADALKQVFDNDSLIGRFGGDEFMVYMKQAESVERVDQRMANLRVLLEAIQLDNRRRFPVHCSAGLVRYGIDADKVTILKSYADEALYYVKNHGKNNHCWYRELQEYRRQEAGLNK